MTELEFNALKIHFYVNTGYVGSKRSDEELLSGYFSYEDWKGLSDDEKDKAIQEVFNDWLYDNIDLGAYVE